jgi:hypothetical protein
VIDVDDFTEVVRLVCPAICAIVTWPAGRWITARQNGCHWGEQVASVKAGREMLRLPVDVPAAHLASSALDQLEHAVAGTDIPAAVGLEKNGWPLTADSWINNTEKDGSNRKPCGIALQLRFLFEMCATRFSLMSASPEGPRDDVSGLDTLLCKLDGDTSDFLDRPADQEGGVIRRRMVFLGNGALAR